MIMATDRSEKSLMLPPTSHAWGLLAFFSCSESSIAGNITEVQPCCNNISHHSRYMRTEPWRGFGCPAMPVLL